jgi:hypothetical protein
MQAVVYTIVHEVSEVPLIEFNFTEKFLKLSQDRVEYLYNTLMVVGSTYSQL